MVKVKRVSGRGTKVRDEELKDPDWAGSKYKKLQQDKLKKAGDFRLVGGRGTRSTKASDVKETKIADAKGYTVSTGRGKKLRRL
jgi:hypothetical protein